MPGVFRSALLSLTLLLATVSTASAARIGDLSREAKGLDVAAMQHLLTAGGEPIAITARYGPTTEEYVRRFQSKRGLQATGTVDSVTWAALTPSLSAGSSGHGVIALQSLLVKKHGYALQQDGSFGPQTEAAVKKFQSHMGLTVSGTVDKATWTALLSHFQEMPKNGPGWYRYPTINRDGGWGRAQVVAILQEVAQKWATSGPVPRMAIGDIGLPHGGPIPGHKSHQRGVDVDIRIARNDGREGLVDYRDLAYSRLLTQRLVDLLMATGEVELILFNDSGVRGVTPWPNHDHHMHVRFKR